MTNVAMQPVVNNVLRHCLATRRTVAYIACNQITHFVQHSHATRYQQRTVTYIAIQPDANNVLRLTLLCNQMPTTHCDNVLQPDTNNVL